MNKYDKWCNKFPANAGYYWFYGDPDFGSMGSDYSDNPEVDEKLYFVEVRKVNNGWFVVADGRFLPDKPFKKSSQKPGYLGFWKNCELPETDLDVKGLLEKKK